MLTNKGKALRHEVLLRTMEKDTTMSLKGGNVDCKVTLGAVACWQGYEHYETALWRRVTWQKRDEDRRPADQDRILLSLRLASKESHA